MHVWILQVSVLLPIWPLQFVAQFWSSWAPASSSSGLPAQWHPACLLQGILLQVLHLLDMLHSVVLFSFNFQESSLMCLFLDDQVFFILLFTEKVAGSFSVCFQRFCLLANMSQHPVHCRGCTTEKAIHRFLVLYFLVTFSLCELYLNNLGKVCLGFVLKKT